MQFLSIGTNKAFCHKHVVYFVLNENILCRCLHRYDVEKFHWTM